MSSRAERSVKMHNDFQFGRAFQRELARPLHLIGHSPIYENVSAFLPLFSRPCREIEIPLNTATSSRLDFAFYFYKANRTIKVYNP